MERQSIERIVAELEKNRVRYLIVGGLAVVAHGFVRFTADLDIVLDMNEENLRKAVSALSSLGYRPRAPVPLEHFADAEKRMSWVHEKGLTVLSLWSQRAPLTEIDLFIENPFDDFSRAYAEAERLEIAPHLTAPIVSYKDLITLKKNAGRPQDLRDIEELQHIHEDDDLDG